MSIMANTASAGRARDVKMDFLMAPARGVGRLRQTRKKFRTVLTEQVLEKEHRNKAQTKEAIDVTRSHGMFPMAGPVRNR